MLMNEVASAADTLQLWKLVNDSVWTALQQQQREENERKAAARRAAVAKRSSRKPKAKQGAKQKIKAASAAPLPPPRRAVAATTAAPKATAPMTATRVAASQQPVGTVARAAFTKAPSNAHYTATKFGDDELRADSPTATAAARAQLPQSVVKKSA